MKARGVLLLLAGVALGGLLGLGILYLISGRGAPGRPQAQVGAPAPDFALMNLAGQEEHLSDYKGKAVLINFWATWCQPCKNEMPLLQQYARKHADGLVVLGLNAGESATIAADFVKKNQIDFPVLLETSGSTAADYAVRGYPTSFFVDRDGVLRAMHIGELTEEALQQYLKLAGVE